MQSRVLPAGLALARGAARDAALLDAWRALWVSRLLVWAAGVVAVLAFGLSARASDFDPAGLTSPFGATGDALVAPAARWDSVWYLAIAGDGYEGGAREAFFPLYPLLVRAGGALVGSPLIAGALISTALLAVALVLLHRLVALDFGRDVARGAVLAARHDRWALAGTLGALAATTRSAGVLLLVPLALIYLYGAGRPSLRPRALRPDVLWLALVPLGLGAFCAYLGATGHDALAPFRAQEVWFRSFAGPFAGAWDGVVAGVQGMRQLLSGSRSPVYFAQAGGDPFVVARHNVELLTWLVLLVPAAIGALRRLPSAYGAYLVAAIALPLSYPVAPQPLMSLPRFVAVLFPLAIWLALWMTGRPWRERLVLAAFAVALAVYTAIFATWHWVA